MTPPDWDDERLDAAFREGFDRPAPPDLERAVHVRIAGTSPARFPAFRRSGQVWALAAAAVVVVLIGSLTVGLAGFGRTVGSPAPSVSGVHPTPGASATPTEQAVPGAIFGLPIIHVPDAIAIRDSGVDDREFAVLGWFTPAPVLPCPFTPTVSPLQVRCPDDHTWLTEDAESLVHVAGGAMSFDTPNGPALNPDLDGLDTTWIPDTLGTGQDTGSTPVDVVFVGHFDDRRAALCQAAEQAACRDRFVVDSVAMVRGSTTTADRVSPTTATTRTTAFDVEAIVANEAPQSQVLSMIVVNGQNELATFEPSLGTGQQNLIDQPTLWLVRALESERISTYIVVDGSDAIYEMNPEGQAILVGGTPPAPGASASPSSWPPVGARVIALTSEVGAGDPPVRVAVLDASGRLTGVAEKGSRDPSTLTLDQPIEAYPELDVSPGRIHLVWVGGICDSQITVTVAADIKTITFDMGPQPVCDSIGIERQLVLDFSGLIEVPSIKLVRQASAATDAPGYELDCGPVAADICEAKAAQIIAANPSPRVASIVFSDECGSYVGTFEDGTGVSAIIDCMPEASPS